MTTVLRRWPCGIWLVAAGLVRPATGSAQQYTGTNLVTNGTFSVQPAGTAIAAGTDLNGWYSARVYTGSTVDAAEGQVADQAGTATYRAGSAIRQVPFPGDASNGVPASNTWLLYNGNLGVAGSAATASTAFYWNQNITVASGAAYVFSLYASNAENPTQSGKALPVLGLRIRKTDNTAIANLGAVTIAEEATANGGQDVWTRYQFTIPAENMAAYIAAAGSNMLRFILYDGSTTVAANGGDLALTAISLRRVNQVPRGQQTAPTVFGRQGAVAIPTLRADDPDADGAVVGYKITVLPPAAQGTLYLNGSAVRLNQALTTTEAALLTFDPNTGFSGNALFTYTATDNLGAESLPLNYGIPVNDNVCNTQSLFSFGDRTLAENWQTAQTATVDGVVITSTYTPAAATPDALSLVIDDQTGADPSGAQPGKGLVWAANYAAGGRQSSLKLAFTDATTSAPKLLQSFTMVVGDIDRASALGVSPAVGFVDQVVFSGTDANGNTVTLSAADVALAPTNTLSATNTLLGTGNSGSPAGNIVLAFPVPVRDVTITYASADAAANPANQAISLLFLSWCGEADLATTLSGPATAAAGQTVYYYATTTNNGPRATARAVTTIILPGKPAASTVSVPNGTYDATTGVVTFTPSALAVGAQAVNYVSFVMPAGIASFTGQARSSALEIDNTATNNNGSATAANVTTTVGATGAAGPVVSCPPTPGKNGTPAPITAAPNTYFLPSANAAAGQKTIGLSATTLSGAGVANAGTALAPGDLVLLVQMQGAAIAAANDDTYGDGVAGPSANGNATAGFTAGRYEYGIVAPASATITPGTAGTLTLRDNLTYAYAQAAATATQGKQTYQVIRIPQYAALTLGGNIAPPAWNGTLGGVLALDVVGPLNFATYSLDASGKGFRGGAGRALAGTAGFAATDYRTANTSNGSKGEGTAGTPQYVATYTASGTVATLVNTGATNTYPNGDAGRGAPGTAGGGGTDGNPTANDQNSGGGGGANGGRGGRGGNSWTSALAVGGEPGAAFPLASSSRLVLGGGGGAGTTNNGTGTDGTGAAYDGLASSGAPGGGLVLVRTGSVLGSGSILANGYGSDNSVQNDGAGGGGAGGSILLTAQQTSTLGNVKLIANGGTGGTNNPGGGPHGPGGGGGAGIIVANGPVASAAALPGANGLTINNATPGIAFGAEAGTVGIANPASSNSIAGSAAGAGCVTDVASVVTGPSTAAATSTVNLAVNYTNYGAIPATSTVATVSLPLGTAGVSAPGGTVATTATAIVVTFPVTSLASGASQSYTLSYTAPASGSVVANSAITTTAAEPYTANNTSTVTTAVGAYADVTTTITGPASVNPNIATSNFTANFTNNGPLAATSVGRSVTLPVGASISSAQLTALQGPYGATTAYNATTRTLTFPALATLLAGATNTVVFPITASATPGAATIQSNVGTSTSNQTTIAGNLPDAATFGFTVAPLADVATTITNNAVATVAAGGTGTFIAAFTNNGPSAATNVVGSVQLPTGLTNVTATFGGVYDAATGLIIYPAAASLASGASVTSTITFTMPGGPVAASSVVNTDANEGTNTANNTATAAINASSNFDVTTRLSGPTTAAPGTSVTLSVVTLNAGPGPAPSTTQTVVIPGVFPNLYVSNGGTYANNGTSTTVTFPAALGLASGANVNNSITLTMPATALTNITATVAAAGETSSLANTATATVGTAPANAGTVNLFTTISAAPADAPATPLTGPVVPNTTLELTITAGNYGPGAATNAVTRVALPAGLAGVVPSNEGTYDATTGLVTFPAASNLAQGALVAYTIQLPAPAAGPLVPVASITSATPETVVADNVASTKVDITLLADVTTAIVGPVAPTAGQNATYAITTTNNGPTTATGVVQTVLLPLGLSSVTLTNAAGTTIAGGTYNAATGLYTLPAAAVAANQLASASVLNYVTFATPPATSYPVTAGVSTTTPESNSTNNAATVVTTPTPSADLSVALSGPGGAETVLQGNPVTYTVATTNTGASVNPSSTTTVQLPAGLANVQVSGGGSYNTSTGVVTFPASSDQAVGAAGAVTNTITFVAPTATPITLTAQVAVTPAGNDPNLNNNSATLNTDVTPASTALVDESTTIAATVGGAAASVANPAIAGSAVRFVVTSVNNTAGTAATGVSQRVQLPAGLNAADVTYPTGTAGTYDANTGVVTFPAVASQASTATSTYTINVAVAPGGSTALTATAYVSTTNSDSNPTNNAISVTVPVSPRADVTTTIAGPAKVLPGSVATYLVTTRNVGPSAAASVNTTVQLPAGLAGVVVSGGGVYDANSGLVTFPTVNSLPGYSGPAAASQAAPQLEYTISLTAPSTLTATAGYAVTSTVATATTEPATNATNTAALTTTAANQPPVASNVVNSLQAPEANTALQLPISPLAATDPDGSVSTFTLTSLPTSGTLFYNSGPTYTALTSANLLGGGSQLNLTPTQAQTLRYSPAAGFAGNAFFSYLATDNGSPALSSLPALYTIPVGVDASSQYAYTPVKGSATPYATGDILAYVTDTNGAQYNPSGVLYNPTTGALADATVANGLSTAAGSTNALLAATGPSGNPANTLPTGVSLNAVTGQLFVSDATKLARVTTATTYTVNITTIDLYGGRTTQPVAFTIGAYPLPVSLTAFTAQAVQNRDALVSWTTASELNSAYFVVERSLDGTTFVKAGQVAGQGNSLTTTSYTFTDAGIGQRATGAVYYRLRQVDVDGTSAYSPVRTVGFTKAAVALSLYPNPAQRTTQLDLSQLPGTATYQVLVLDAVGRQVLAASVAGGAPQPLEVQALPTGTYQVLVTGTLADGSALRQVLRLTKD